MGYRTVISLTNDAANYWEKDPELGRLIMIAAMNGRGGNIRGLNGSNYGEVVQCAHADVNSLIEFTGYSGKYIIGSHWRSGETEESRRLELLKSFADSMGYAIRKKAKK